MRTIRDILDVKGSKIWSVSSADTVLKALHVLAAANIGAVVVMDGAKVVGIFSERDYARKVVLRGRSSKETLVREVLTAHVLGVEPSRTIEESLALMTDKHVRHLPVVEGDEVVGVVSIGDLVGALLAEKEFLIGELVRYIAQTPAGTA
jgi:CBS domain-containing protein